MEKYCNSLIVSCFSVTLLLLLQLAGFTESFSEISRQKESKCSADEFEDWTYRGAKGPEHWGNTYPDCNGTEQSPIEIDSSTVERDETLRKLQFFHYEVPVTEAELRNTGHTIEVRPDGNSCRMISVNDMIYTLDRLEFHWGSDKKKGAEHIIDKSHYAMEMHLIHESSKGDLAIVAVLFKQEKEDNENLEPIVLQLPNLMHKGDTAPLNCSLNLDQLLPENPATFYRYNGSLTHPDCRENVVWSVLKKTASVSTRQIQRFRQTYSTTKPNATGKCRISNNNRPVKDRNGRKVYLSQ